MDYTSIPRLVVEDLVRLRRRLDAANVPPRRTDHNVIIGTWNIRAFGGFHPSYDENPDSPKRNLRALVYIAEIVRRFDVIAIQEVRRDTTGIRKLVSEFLGPNWGVLLSDVASDASGRTERLAYLYDKRRVTPSGLAGEIVIPPNDNGNPAEQFDRTPYIVGFQAGTESFSLLTAHIRYGHKPEDRLPELRALAGYVAKEIRNRARSPNAEETNLIVLGDFNIDTHGSDDPLFQAFLSTGLNIPEALKGLRTTYGTQPKHYDQIAWFMGYLNLLSEKRAGVIDFTGAVYKELTLRQVSDRLSDHFPLWVEFIIDRSTVKLARALGFDPDIPDPLSGVPD